MKSQTGFTLIELLVATTIIIVLSAIGVVSFMNSGKSARDSRRKADMETVRQAMVLYKAENGEYPNIGQGGHSVEQYNVLLDLMSEYMPDPSPRDPKNEDNFVYVARFNDQSKICVCATLESDTGNENSRSCSTTETTAGGYYCVLSP